MRDICRLNLDDRPVLTRVCRIWGGSHDYRQSIDDWSGSADDILQQCTFPVLLERDTPHKSLSLNAAFRAQLKINTSHYTIPFYFRFLNRAQTETFGSLLLPSSETLALHENRKVPLVLHIYGGPTSQLVCNRFLHASMTRVNWLVSLGYGVLLLDNRGTFNRGHQFEQSLYQNFGKDELVDWMDAVALLASALKSTIEIDFDRIALYGWSYGGFLALRGISLYPDYFRTVIAGAPVTDWTLYDTAYTERYLGLLQKDVYDECGIMKYACNFPNE